jgi:hypothetical protein
MNASVGGNARNSHQDGCVLGKGWGGQIELHSRIPKVAAASIFVALQDPIFWKPEVSWNDPRNAEPWGQVADEEAVFPLMTFGDGSSRAISNVYLFGFMNSR